MKKLLFPLIFFLVLTGCDGYYRAAGIVSQIDNTSKHPLDSVTVKVYCGEDWLRGTTITDSTGQYEVSGLTSPFRSIYCIVFEKKGFKTDTVKIQGSRGKTLITFDQTMKKN